MNKKIFLLRLSQVLLVTICMLRECINCITDIEQYSKNLSLFYKITSFPTREKAGLLFNRSISSSIINHFGPIILVIAHMIVFLILLYGIVILLKHIKTSDFQLYNTKKFVCIIGLCLGLAEYFFLYGFLAMDYFLSWMHNIDYDGDIAGYGLPLIISLLYLSLKDYQEYNP